MPTVARTPVLRLSSIISTLVVLLALTAISASAASAHTEYRGANVHSLQTWNESDAQMNHDLDALQAAGANLARVDVTWSALEPAKGQYSADYTARIDAFVAGAKARGIKLIATVACTPTWASTGGKWNDAPSNPSDYGDIARYLTAHYGTQLAAIEAWNEPDWHDNLIASDLPATYAAMLKAFYTGAKQGDPNVDVLAGATAYTDPTFFKALWAHGIKGYYDGLSIHPYADGAAPSDTTVHHSFIGAITALHAAQTAIGDNTPLWITEFAWPTGTWNGVTTSEQLSATYLQQAFQILDNVSYVKGATAYQLRDQGNDTTNPEDNYGLMHQDFTPRPAYAAFKAAMQDTNTAQTDPAPSSTGPGTTPTAPPVTPQPDPVSSVALPSPAPAPAPSAPVSAPIQSNPAPAGPASDPAPVIPVATSPTPPPPQAGPAGAAAQPTGYGHPGITPPRHRRRASRSARAHIAARHRRGTRAHRHHHR